MKLDLATALEILGSSDLDPIARLQEELLEQAAQKLLAEIDDDHPDHPEKCAELAAEITEAVEAREEINRPVEGWDYWFGDSSNFRAYENALKIFNLDA
jgi:hypothetical protein